MLKVCLAKAPFGSLSGIGEVTKTKRYRMTTSIDANYLRARLFVLGLACITGSNYLVMKITVAELSPLSLIFWRFVFASVFLAGFAFKSRVLKSSSLWRDGAITGALLALALILLAVAIQSAGSGETAFWVSSDAAFVPVLSYALFRVIPSRQTLIGIVVSLVGLALLSITSGLHFRTGSIVGILSAASFAVWIVALEAVAKRHAAVALGFVQMVVALAVSSVAALLAGSLNAPASTQSWICCMYLGAVGTGIRFAVQAHLQRTVSATETALIYLVEPVFAAVLGAIFLSELLSGAQIVGCALILFGVGISQSSSFKRTRVS